MAGPKKVQHDISPVQELVRRGVGSHDIDVAMREVFGPDVQKLHIHGDCTADNVNEEGVGRYSGSPCFS